MFKKQRSRKAESVSQFARVMSSTKEDVVPEVQQSAKVAGSKRKSKDADVDTDSVNTSSSSLSTSSPPPPEKKLTEGEILCLKKKAKEDRLQDASDKQTLDVLIPVLGKCLDESLEERTQWASDGYAGVETSQLKTFKLKEHLLDQSAPIDLGFYNFKLVNPHFKKERGLDIQISGESTFKSPQVLIIWHDFTQFVPGNVRTIRSDLASKKAESLRPV